MHGLEIYVKPGIPCASDPNYEEIYQPYMRMRMPLVNQNAYMFYMYRPCDDNLAVNIISNKIDKILVDNPSANINVCDDFNIHNKEWLVYSNKTTPEETKCHNFSVLQT